jgi:hypothetical protein
MEHDRQQWIEAGLRPSDVWPTESRELLAVDQPVAVAGESDGDPIR